MDFIYEFEDQTYKLSKDKAKNIVDDIVKKYDELYDARKTQIDETNALRNEIYQRNCYVEDKEKAYKTFKLPEMTELFHSLNAHLYENIYKTPESMFDCQGEDEDSQTNAATQKAMLANAFTKMNIQPELEKMSASCVDSGEAVFYITWEKRVKRVRRKKTALEELKDNIISSFQGLFGRIEIANIEFAKLTQSQSHYVEYDKLIYEGAVVKCLDNLEFVFDPFKSDDFEKSDMIYRSHKTYDDLICNKTYNLSAEAKEELKKFDEEYRREENEIKKDGDKEKNKTGLIEILEYYGNIKIDDKRIRNYLVVVADKKHIIRFEPNPYIHKPFVYGNIIEDPDTRRGISPLRVAKSLNDIASEILSKQVYAYDLVVNPVWLTPAKMLKKDTQVKPGEVIEYDADKLSASPLKPEKLDFSKAFTGFEFISYFKGLIERATGIFKNMVGAEEQRQKTATETQAVVAGQSARQNQITVKIYSRLIIPMIEKVADTIANEQFGTQELYQFDKSANSGSKIEINDKTRNGNYRYIYSDCKANAERTVKFDKNLQMIKAFMESPEIKKRVDIVELFRLALENGGFDNTGRIIYDDKEEIDKNVNEINKQKVIQDYAQSVFTGQNVAGDQGLVANNGQMGVPANVPPTASL